VQELRKFTEKPANMLKKSTKEPQLEMFKTVLETLVNPSHELCLLGKQIDWDSMETEFAPLYGTTGRPSVPIRTMVGLLLLKQIYNLGDETVMERWVENPYWQHFCGEIYFQYKAPFDPSDFVHFRKRIGKEGMESIFKQSIILFGEEKLQKATKEVRIDTTVQEKNITFPTDRKLYTKVLDHCRKIARVEGIRFKRSYARQIKNLQYQLRFATKPKNHKKQAKLQEKYRRIVVRLCDDLIDQLSEEQYIKHYEKFDIMFSILVQQRSDKNKIYSVHEPNTQCIAKGKDHKPYEFGNKSSFGYFSHTDPPNRSY
jgi:transposase, IS5 family